MFRWKLGAAAVTALVIGSGEEALVRTGETVVGCKLGVPVPDVTRDAVPEPARDPAREAAWVTAVEPKPLSEQVRKGLDWLASRQRESGGWDQGEQSQATCRTGEPADVADVADTCVAALALVRSGSTPRSGRYARELERAVGFLCGEIEESDKESLYVTDVRGTRIQAKIGTYVDTFLASMLLAELKDAMPTEAGNQRLRAALSKVLDKIERNQRADGGFGGDGWAPVLAESLAGKGLNRAAQNGVDVSAGARLKADEYFSKRQSGAGPSAGPGSAGVLLYDSAANLGALQESANTAAKRERELKDLLASAKDEKERDRFRAELDGIAVGRKAQEEAQASVVARLDEQGFVEGFGSNGGEEFLSYMNISESLVVDADDTWRRWDGQISSNLSRVQNPDGSWSGHHCITGRTFCTSAALLTLMADRAPIPAEALAARK